MADFESGFVGHFLQFHKKRKDTPVGASAWQYVYLSLSPGYQQLPSSHATDREAVVVVSAPNIVYGYIYVSWAEVQSVWGANGTGVTVSRWPIVAVDSLMAQRTISEVAAAQKVVGGVQPARSKQG